MSDDAYLEALRTRLLAATPADFDAGPGTGVDLRVTGVRRVEDGRWPEVAIAYVATPTGPDDFAPVVGEVRRPIDAEWRRLSLYDDPDRYARALTRAVAGAAWRRLSRPSGERTRPAGGVPVDEAWRWLLDSLAGYGAVREPSRGRIEVTEPSGVVLTFLVTPEEWASIHREVDGLPLELDELIGPRLEDEVFFVFDEGGFVRSVREELPAVRGTALERRIAAIRAADPDARFVWSDRPGADVIRDGADDDPLA